MSRVSFFRMRRQSSKSNLRFKAHKNGLLTGLILLLAGTTYAQDSQFNFDLNGNLIAQTPAASAPPQILGQPQTVLVAVGEVAAFSVVVANARTISYQWRFDGTDLAGATKDA